MLNPFEIKVEIARIINELSDIKDFEHYQIHFRTLDAQDDKKIICKLLFKEIGNKNTDLIKFLLIRYCPKEELIEKLWSIIKNNLSSNQAKIFALDLLRDIDVNWTYDSCDEYLENPGELVNSDTKKILDNAILNPEVQIDFLDFINSLPESDKIILINSLANDYSKDELANMLIPVFLSSPVSEAGKTALDVLGNSKSQLAYHALNSYLNYADKSLIPSIKRNISTLKLAGIREDNTKEFYKNLLSKSKPYRFCITYPDGQGNQAVIFSRENENIQFVAIVTDDYKGVKDCFGFNEISKFECNALIERFYRGQRAVDLKPEHLKYILLEAEKLSEKLPYEYVCWKNLLADIEPEKPEINYEVKKLSDDEFDEILKYDFTDFWFLDPHYSDEFENFLEIAEKTPPEDFDKIIDENIDNIFYEEEKNVWTERIYHTAILKDISGEKRVAQNLNNLYNDKNLIRELFKNIVRKSLYEYYFSQKNDNKVKKIEEMWVK